MDVCETWLGRDFLARIGRPVDLPPCTCCPPVHTKPEGQTMNATESAPSTYLDMPVVRCHLVRRDISHMAHVFDDEPGKVVCRGLLPHSVGTGCICPTARYGESGDAEPLPQGTDPDCPHCHPARS